MSNLPLFLLPLSLLPFLLHLRDYPVGDEISLKSYGLHPLYMSVI
jgi:hypothetical protein